MFGDNLCDDRKDQTELEELIILHTSALLTDHVTELGSFIGVFCLA